MLRQACGYKLANDGHDTRAIQASRRLARRCTESCNLVKWVRGKASAERVAHLCFFGIFGNYATGGALNFHTRTGAQVNGFEIGADAGSFGYFNNYMTVGQKTGPLEYSLFASDVRGEGFIANSAFNTPTVNFLGLGRRRLPH